MKRISLSRAIAIAVMIASPAQAQQAASAMTCAQAIAAFERDGVIMVSPKGGAPVPVKAGTPVAKSGSLLCTGRGNGSVMSPYMVRTTDNPRCVVAVRCS